MAHIRAICFYLLMGASAGGLVWLAAWITTQFLFLNRSPYLSRPRQLTSHGEAVSFEPQLRVVDARSGDELWRGPRLSGACIVGQQFLVCNQNDKTVVFDFDEYRKVPLQKRQGRNWRDLEIEPLTAFDRKSMGLGVPLDVPESFLVPTFSAIPGTNRFLAQYHDLMTGLGDHLFACEIESGRIKTLAHWRFQSPMLFIGASGDVFSVRPGSIENANSMATINSDPNPSSPVVEVRSSDDFRILRTMPLPKELWRNWTLVRNGLLSQSSTTLKRIEVFELESMSRVPELNLQVHVLGQEEVEADRRYSMLSDYDVRRWRRLVVYDTEDHKVVYDSGTARELSDARVIDGRLQLETTLLGKTHDWIDLQSGKRVQVEYVGLWLIVTCVLTILTTLVWCAVWIRFGPRSTIWASANVLFLGVLLLVPSTLGGFNRVRLRQFSNSLTVDYAFSLILSIGFCLTLYAMCSTGRRLLKTIPLLVFSAALFFLIQRTGAVRIDPADYTSSASLAWRIWLTFTFLTTAGLAILRATGLRLTTEKQWQYAKESLYKSDIPLIDLFIITIFVAPLYPVFTPYYELVVVSDNYASFVLGRSTVLALAASIGTLPLILGSYVQRFTIGVGLTLAVVGTFGIMAVIALEPYSYQNWYLFALALHKPLLVALSSFIFCWALRSAGLVLVYLKLIKVQSVRSEPESA